MQDYQKTLIEEHSQLFGRINVLHQYVYGDKSNKDNKVEFANKCIQLAAMKKYEEALSARLENVGIYFEEGDYLERIATINKQVPQPCTCSTTNCKCGSDFDADSKVITNSKSNE